jgi:hypothetical protein
MNIHPPISSPKDGSRILLHYKIYTYEWQIQQEVYVGDKWEECRWIDEGGSKGFEPWCGKDKIHITTTIKPEHVIGWIELPKEED